LAVYLIIASVFVAVFLFFFAILYVISKRRDPVQLRLKSLTEEDEGNKEDGRSSLEGVVDIAGHRAFSTIMECGFSLQFFAPQRACLLHSISTWNTA
jgi:hypothetical protein